MHIDMNVIYDVMVLVPEFVMIHGFGICLIFLWKSLDYF